MDLTYRSPETTDLDACVRLLVQTQGFAYPDDLRARLPRIWETLLEKGCFPSMVLEDGERPAPDRIIAFGAGVFVSDAFACEARAGKAPFVSARALAAIEGRGDSPILDLAAQREANAGAGLNLLNLHYAAATNYLPPDDQRRVAEKVIESYLACFRGYQIKEILQEFFGVDQLPIVQAGGFLLRTDYTAFYQGGPLPPPSERPYLLGIIREEAFRNWGSTLSPLFVYSAPRFNFGPREQQLLQRALIDDRDDALAAALRVSPSAIKKRWRVIYERVAARDPDLLPSPEEAQAAGPRRGAEKRQRLLRYLRAHPEELRPGKLAPAGMSGISLD